MEQKRECNRCGRTFRQIQNVGTLKVCLDCMAIIKQADGYIRLKQVFHFDIRVQSEANLREHWANKNRRKKSQQKDFAIIWRKHDRPVPELPCTITFIRHSCQLMDSDNLAGAFKHVRDQLAKEIGIDDGSDKITWVYKQVKIPKRQHYFILEIN